MSSQDPVFRNPDMFQVLPHREYLRRVNEPPHFKRGHEGFVVEDLDVLFRTFGPAFQTDAKGKFMIVEEKHPGAKMQRAQEMTFGLLDDVCRKGDPLRERYLGFYVLEIGYDAIDYPIFPVKVNGHRLSETMYKAWVEMRHIIKGFFD